VNSRLAPLVGGCLLAAALGALLVGAAGDGGGPGVVLPLAAVGGGGLLVARRPSRQRTLRDPGWASAGSVASAVPWARPPASTWRLARALGRVEARELLQSGAFGIGLGFCALLVLLFGFVWAPVNPDPWFDLAPMAPWFCLPLVGMTVVGAHRAVTRAHRDGVEELLGTCPVPETTRTVGFLLSAVTPVSALVVFLAVGAAALAMRSPRVYGSLDGRDRADLAAALVLGAGGVALGVALGRWLRFPLVPIVAVVAVGFGGGRLAEVGGHDWNPYATLAMAPTIEWDSPVFQARPSGWHLVWVLSLSAVVALVAVARHRWDRLVRGLALAATAAVVLSGVASTRPMSSASATRIATAISDPGAVQECTASGSVTVCLYPVHRPTLRRLLEDIAPVVAVLPDGAGPITLRQRYDGELADLPPEVRRRLREEDLRIPAGEVAIEFGTEFDGGMASVPSQLAVGAVGLPDQPDAALLPMVVAGQARGVVALWLATRGLDADDAESLTTSPLPTSDDPYERGSLGEGDCYTPALVWSAQDLAAARAVVALPEDAVRRVVWEGWARWTDPSTGTDDLLGALGLARAGPYDHVEARPGNPC
jgi:hypothetical protein